ncbi:hypothetical protein Tco_0844396 [Tanacetum coccineum]
MALVLLVLQRMDCPFLLAVFQTSGESGGCIRSVSVVTKREGQWNGELEKAVDGCNWLDMMIVYCRKLADEHRDFSLRVNRDIAKDLRLAREINALCNRLTIVIDERHNFIDELNTLVVRGVPGKMVEFIGEVQGKDIPNLIKL